MFVPEYTITPNTLKNITSIEYNRSLIENSSILPNFQVKLEKDAAASFISGSLEHMGELPNTEVIKKYIDGLTKLHSPKIVNLVEALRQVENLAATFDFEEKDIKFLHSVVSKGVIPNTKQGLYRSSKEEYKIEPETILAEVNELLDWYSGLDAKDNNPIIVAGIFKGQLETIFPFEKYNFLIANLCVRITLQSRGYQLDRYITPETFYNASKADYEDGLHSIVEEEGDFTPWLEYFTTGMAAQIATVAEQVKLYARDTKLAKANGRIDLTPRQARIVEYLQDYGILRNQQFELLFPEISEDSVLRDLKKLVDSGIVVKRGKTKSSRYELR